MTALRASLHLAVCLWLGLGASPSTALSGDAIVALIRAAMVADGKEPPQMPPPMRGLPDCDHSPDVVPFAGSWASAELRCESPVAWRRVLRTGAGAVGSAPRSASHATVSQGTRTVLVAARPLARGARIQPDDLAAPDTTTESPLHGITAREHAIGRKLRVALAAGQPVLERHLETDFAIETGQRIHVILARGGIEISTSGIAEGSGQIGDRIVLRTSPGGPRIEALVVAPLLVRVGPNISAQDAVKR